MGGAGFEPAKAMPPDLQSGPFNHLGIHPSYRGSTCAFRDRRVPNVPSIPRALPPDRAGGESRTHNRRFTKPVLCRLSYASDRLVRPGREIPKYTPFGVICKAFPSQTDFSARDGGCSKARPSADEHDRVVQWRGLALETRPDGSPRWTGATFPILAEHARFRQGMPAKFSSAPRDGFSPSSQLLNWKLLAVHWQ